MTTDGVPKRIGRPLNRRCWAFTLRFQELDKSDNAPTFDHERQRGLVFQLERGDTTGYTHWQGYVEYVRSTNFNRVKTDLGDPAVHIEPALGSRSQNIAYCTKQDTRVRGPFVFPDGFDTEDNKQGYRRDLIEIKERLDDGASLVQVASQSFATFCRNYKAFEKYLLLVQPPRSWKSHVIVAWGATGTNKSRFAHERDPKAYWLGPSHSGSKVHWFDGYDGQETVVLDEFRPSQWEYTQLLQLLDRYPYRAQTKGGTANFIPREIIITTSQNPDTWYSSETDGKEQCPYELRRRINHVMHFKRNESGNVEMNVDDKCSLCLWREQKATTVVSKADRK